MVLRLSKFLGAKLVVGVKVCGGVTRLQVLLEPQVRIASPATLVWCHVAMRGLHPISLAISILL